VYFLLHFVMDRLTMHWW